MHKNGENIVELQGYQLKMGKIKRILFVCFITSMILSLASIIMLGLFHIAGVFTIHTGNAPKYAEPFTYPGWQSLYGFGGSMIIQGYDENTFDILMISAIFLPLIGGIVTSIMMLTNFKRRGTNKKKAILEFIMAGLLIFSGIVILLCDKVWILNASKVGTGSYANYYTDYLIPAIEGQDGGYFHLEAYPIILGIVCLVTSLVKIGNGTLLLYQRKVAKDFKMSQTTIQVEEKQ